jgi:type IV secretory pathway VirB10-like protein
MMLPLQIDDLDKTAANSLAKPKNRRKAVGEPMGTKRAETETRGDRKKRQAKRAARGEASGAVDEEAEADDSESDDDGEDDDAAVAAEGDDESEADEEENEEDAGPSEEIQVRNSGKHTDNTTNDAQRYFRSGNIPRVIIVSFFIPLILFFSTPISALSVLYGV